MGEHTTRLLKGFKEPRCRAGQTALPGKGFTPYQDAKRTQKMKEWLPVSASNMTPCFRQTFRECTLLGSDISTRSLSASRNRQFKKNKCSLMLFISMSIVVHTEWQPAAVHTEGPCGPNSDPPRPCPSGWAAAPSRCRLLNPGGCRSCCPATS